MFTSPDMKMWVEHRTGPRRNHKWEIVEQCSIELNTYVKNLLFSGLKCASKESLGRNSRGIPKQCSDEFKKMAKVNGNRRRTSWFSVLELLRHPWDEKRNHFEGYINLNQAALFQKGIFPAFATQHLLIGTKILTNQEMDQFVRVTNSSGGMKRFDVMSTDGKDLGPEFWTWVKWCRSDSEFMPEFLTYLLTLKRYDMDFSRTRIVFFQVKP